MAALLFLAGLGLAILRIGPLPSMNGVRLSAPWVLTDFHHAVYYPTHAFWHGVNPYNSRTYLASYPAEAPFAGYAPATFLVYLPAAFMLTTESALSAMHPGHFARLALLSINGLALLALFGLYSRGALKNPTPYRTAPAPSWHVSDPSSSPTVRMGSRRVDHE